MSLLIFISQRLFSLTWMVTGDDGYLTTSSIYNTVSIIYCEAMPVPAFFFSPGSLDLVVEFGRQKKCDLS